MTAPGYIVLLGGGLLGAVVGGAIFYATCEPEGYDFFQCEGQAFLGGVVGLVVGLCAAGLLWTIWQALRSSHGE